MQKYKSRDIAAMLWDSRQHCPQLGQSIYLPKVESVCSFVNCVMCKLLWFLDHGCCGVGGLQGHHFYCMTPEAGKFLIQTSCPFWWGPFLALEPKAATHLVLPLVLPSIPQLLVASVFLDPTLFTFLADSKNSDRCLPACLHPLLDSFIPFIPQMFL